MTGFLFRRLLQSLAIVFAVATLTFFLVHAAPGDPVQATLSDPRVPESVRESLRQLYGFDQPLLVQYRRYMFGVLTGNLGFSLSQQRPVLDVLGDAVPPTLLLMGTALVTAFAVGIIVGALQGVRVGSRFDRLTSAATTTLATLPDFWLALGVMLFVAPLLGLPMRGMTSPDIYPYLGPAGRAWDILRHLVLPVLSIAIIAGSIVARYQRAAMLDAWREDYVRTARAAGVPRRRLIFRHALRNALLPIVTLLGLALPALVAGAVFVEKVYSWPGMGRTAVDALGMRDYSVVIGVAIVAGAFVAVGGLLADLLYAAIDPRVRRA
jgi:peptide/nickel transport system permease protein